MKFFWIHLRCILLLCAIGLNACRTTNREMQVSSVPDSMMRRMNRILVPAKINGQSARFMLDTGADTAYLLADSAKRLGLTTSRPTHPENAWMVGISDECLVTVNGHVNPHRFPVIELPGKHSEPSGVDGFLGWTYYNRAIFSIDAENLTVTVYERVPEKVKSWLKLPLRRNATKFIFEVPLPGGKFGEVFVDTGAPDGVGLYPERWVQWRKDNPRSSILLTQSYMPYRNTGLVIREAAMAEKIALGPLELTSVPVEETTPVANSQYSRPKRLATLGMAALKRMDVLVDGRHGFVYLRPK